MPAPRSESLGRNLGQKIAIIGFGNRLLFFSDACYFFAGAESDRSLIVIRGIRDNNAHNYAKGFTFALASEGRWAGFPGQNLQR